VYAILVGAEFVLALLTFLGLVFITAPYGRYGRPGWGPTVPARLGWIVMECPASLFFLAIYLTGDQRATLVPLILLGLWQAHYVQRAFVYPFLIRAGGRMPVLLMLLAIMFNLLNAYVNAWWIAQVGHYPIAWLTDPRFVVGVLLFAGGYAINRWADRSLRRLRAPGETGYKIPEGGLYRWVSCPNYLGEIVEWFGWALATWSPAGLAFAVYTTANLAPRAVRHHRWYQQRFPEYPAQRRALIPYVI